LYAVAFILGAFIGRFLNILIDRFPDDKPIPPTRADSATSRPGLKPQELIPILGHFLRQRYSHHTGARIPMRVLPLEVGTGIAFLLLYLKYGLTPEWGVMVFYFSLFLSIAVIDLEQGLIPNKLVYPACLLTLALASFYPLGLAAGKAPLDSFVSSLLGGVVAFVILLIPALIWAGRMGWGDVKLAGLIGLATAFPGSLIALALAILGGGIVAIVFVASKFKQRRESIPFGPFLSAGVMAALLWGKPIVDWYLGLLL